MIHHLSKSPSIANQFLLELRDQVIQKDRLRFRTNLNRLGKIAAYEISKTLNYHDVEVQTPLGTARIPVSDNRIVLCSILRAGLPLHFGLLDFFDKSENGFVSAYRQHHKDGTFEISLEYSTCPNLTNSTLIICDPMLATGASIKKTMDALSAYGQAQKVHVVSIVSSKFGLEYIERLFPNIDIWTFAIDEELTGKSYIVPGMGDAGDLAFGPKEQD